MNDSSCTVLLARANLSVWILLVLFSDPMLAQAKSTGARLEFEGRQLLAISSETAFFEKPQSHVNEQFSSLIGLGLPHGQVALLPSQLRIGNVALEDSETTVIQRLGKPQRIKALESPAIGLVRTFYYPGLRLELAEGEDGRFFVFSIHTDVTKYATQDGIRVGDSKEKVLATYGQASEFTDNGKMTLVYSLPESYSRLSFEINKDKVKSMRCFTYLN